MPEPKTDEENDANGNNPTDTGINSPPNYQDVGMSANGAIYVLPGRIQQAKEFGEAYWR